MKKISLLLTLVTSLLLSSCDFGRDENVWLVGTSPDNPPYQSMENGEVVGFDIDLMIEIGKHLGKEIEFKNMEFHTLLGALSGGNVDMVIAGMSITPERLARVDFSIPYTTANIAILFRQKDGFTSETQLSDKIVGAQLGSIYSLIAHALAVENKNKVNSLSSNLLLVEELISKRIDAVVLEVAQAHEFSEQHKVLSYFEIQKYGSSFAIALPKDSKLKNNIDHTIKTLKRKGIINNLEKKWGLKSD